MWWLRSLNSASEGEWYGKSSGAKTRCLFDLAQGSRPQSIDFDRDPDREIGVWSTPVIAGLTPRPLIRIRRLFPSNLTNKSPTFGFFRIFPRVHRIPDLSYQRSKVERNAHTSARYAQHKSILPFRGWQHLVAMEDHAIAISALARAADAHFAGRRHCEIVLTQYVEQRPVGRHEKSLTRRRNHRFKRLWLEVLVDRHLKDFAVNMTFRPLAQSRLDGIQKPLRPADVGVRALFVRTDSCRIKARTTCREPTPQARPANISEFGE